MVYVYNEGTKCNFLIIDIMLPCVAFEGKEVKEVKIFVKKIGTSKRGPFCTFTADFENGFYISSIASYDDKLILKENTPYNLSLEETTFDGKVRFVLHKEEN